MPDKCLTAHLRKDLDNNSRWDLIACFLCEQNVLKYLGKSFSFAVLGYLAFVLHLIKNRECTIFICLHTVREPGHNTSFEGIAVLQRQ